MNITASNETVRINAGTAINQGLLLSGSSFIRWQAIKAARKAKGISRNQLADTLNIAPRYIASIENSGQHPSLQILYELVTLLDVSVDQFFFPEREQEKSTRRRQLDTMLDTMSETDLKIMSATAKGIEEANNDRTGE